MHGTLEELSPEEIEALEKQIAEEEERRQKRLDSLGIALSKSRSEAIDARQISGLEQIWLEDEEYYEGIDDLNRSSSAFHDKPPGRGIAEDDEDDQGSNIFIEITRPYVDAAAASMGDMLLPTDDSAWAISNTPVPEMIEFSKGKLPRDVEAQIRSQSATEEQFQAKAQQAMSQGEKMFAEAREKAEKAQKRIEDWHVEGQFHAEVRKVIEDAAKLGTGILKGPVPEVKKHVAYRNGELIIEEKIQPVSRRIDLWNFYPDGGCGENVHNGGYVWERDDITSKQLSQLRGAPDYLTDQIDRVLREGPKKATKEVNERVDADGMQKRDTQNLFEIWYYTGQVKHEDLIAAGCDEEMLKEAGCRRGDMFDAMVTMVNNRVIRATLNPLDTGEFPYDVMVWAKRSGSWAGIGVARQIRNPQRMLNGAARNLMDNAGLAGGPMALFKQGVVTPENGIYEIKPRKVWIASEDSDLDHLDNAIRYIQMPMAQVELTAIMYLALKLAEDATGLPAIMQGQMGSHQPDTLGQTEILNNNASTVRRRIARLFDDLVTEPHVRRYYAYLLQYGEDDDEKGEFVIDARGSSNLVERAAQSQEIMQMGQMVSSPIYGLDPKKWAVEWLKSKRLDPKRFEFDDEEWKGIVENLANPQQQQDPRLEIAQMNGQLKQQIEQMKNEFQAQENDKDRQHEIYMEQVDAAIKAELEDMKRTGAKEINIDKIKASLAQEVMRLKTQKELSGVSGMAPQVATPVVEPIGKASPGRAFQE